MAIPYTYEYIQYTPDICIIKYTRKTLFTTEEHYSIAVQDNDDIRIEFSDYAYLVKKNKCWQPDPEWLYNKDIEFTLKKR